VTLKIRLHCDGCIDRIKRRIYKIKGAVFPPSDSPHDRKDRPSRSNIRIDCFQFHLSVPGVKDVAIDAAKDLVKVTGTMDAAALPGYLRDKLSRAVDVVAPGKKDGGGGDKKDKGDKKDGGEEKKDKSAASAAVAPMPMAEAGMYQMPPHYGYAPYAPAPGGYYGGAPAPHPAGFYHPGAGGQYPPPPPPAYPYGASHLHAPQMFSDENPNACSVM